MESRVKIAGHPVHPMLIVYPLGLLSAAVILDIAYVLTANQERAAFSFWAWSWVWSVACSRRSSA